MLVFPFQPYPWQEESYSQRKKQTNPTVKWLHQETLARAICESHFLECLPIPKSPSLRICLPTYKHRLHQGRASDPNSAT